MLHKTRNGQSRSIYFAGVGMFLSLLLVSCLLFSGCTATNTAPQQPAAAPQRQMPSYKYVFAHRILPQGLQGNPQSALLLAFSQEGDAFLRSVWEQNKQLAPEFSREVASPPKVIQRGFLAKDLTFFIIEMPTPTIGPEAYYALVIVELTRNTKKKGLEARQLWYYTLEKTVPSLADLAAEVAGEAPAKPETGTIIGLWTSEPRRINFGPGPVPGDPKAFAAAVFTLFRAKAGGHISTKPGESTRR